MRSSVLSLLWIGSSTSFRTTPHLRISAHRRVELTRMASTTSSVFKRAKLSDQPSTKVIGTHSGTFQADEAMGVWMLRQLDQYRQSPLIRSRDSSKLAEADIVIDVGGIYNHSELKYDHHQRGYDERFPPNADGSTRCTKLSAAGLVYRHYGRDVLKTYYPDLTGADLEWTYVKLYDSLMEALDAVDTGVELVEDAQAIRYHDSTGLPARVGRLNPRWNEDPEPDADERFEQASALCGEDFLAVLIQIVESQLPARAVVEQALKNRFQTEISGEIVAFPSGGLPWKKHLYELEKELKVERPVKFVLYEDTVGKMWRIQAVTAEGMAFENRLSLPEPWRGVRDEDLTSVTKIPGSRFVHAAGFIGGNDTFEGTLQMAKVALEQQHQEP